MIEMPNSHIIPGDQGSAVETESDMITSTMAALMSETQLTFELLLNSTNNTLPEDMVFNSGHKLSIVVYRFVFFHTARSPSSVVTFTCPISFSILMVVSAIGNITVLFILLRRKPRTPSRLDIMLTHLAIADLMVSL